jgi:hypothetical protein
MLRFDGLSRNASRTRGCGQNCDRYTTSKRSETGEYWYATAKQCEPGDGESDVAAAGAMDRGDHGG